MNIRVRQIYYDNNSLAHCEDNYIPYYNPKATPFLESQVIYDLFKSKDYLYSDFYGVFSWKFKSKLLYNSEFVLSQIEHFEYFNHHDIYSFFGRNERSNKNNMWVQANSWHPLFSAIGQLLFHKMGLIDPTTIHCYHIYSNHWIASIDVFERFCSEMLVPAIDLMNNDEDLRELLYCDSFYISKDKASESKCLEIFGKPYYTYHPFIAERLFGTWAAMKQLKVKHI